MLSQFSGNYFAISEIEMLESTPPTPQPPVVTGTGADNSATLNWPAVGSAESYNVKRSTTAGGPYTTIATGVTATTYTDSTVANGTTYYYVVTAVNAVGESGSSNEATVTPQVAPPQDIIFLNGQAAFEGSSLTWTASTGATSYVVQRSLTALPLSSFATIGTVTGATYYVDTTAAKGTTYYYLVYPANAGGQGANSNIVSVTIPNNPMLDIVIAQDKVEIGQEFTADVMLRNVTDIYAEDFTVSYDATKFDYLGFEEVAGYKVYNTPVDQNGTIRFIVASQGQSFGITGDKTFVKLKLKAKATGIGKVDALKCRIADTTNEFDLDAVNCTEDTIEVEGFPDVNRSGEYTLLDLAIDAYYFGQLASNADPVQYNANQAGDEYVTNDDLLFIVTQMLANPNYTPNA